MISVILPVYNADLYIKEAIDSILTQSYTEYELLIIDDGSFDKTKEIVLSFHDTRIKYYHHKNIGLSKTLNRGLKLAKYEYIARMDADDISLPNRLELQMQHMLQHPDCDILGGQIETIDQAGNTIGKRRMPTSREDIARIIEYGCPVNHPTYFVRKQVYNILEGYRNIHSVEDYDFLLRAYEKNFEIHNLSETILQYRIHEKALSQTGDPLHENNILMVQKMHKYRSRGKNKIADDLYSKVIAGKVVPSRRFSMIFRLRNTMVKKRSEVHPVIGFTYLLGIVLLSISSLSMFRLFINDIHLYLKEVR